VNAVLTQLDQLRRHRNVLILATSNLPDSIDGAFLDRADLKLEIGPPGDEGRRQILASCLKELARCGIIQPLDSDVG
jgi:SpoVK/Ycf46/Vps4 family AAA+-type ATPase